MRGDFTRDTFDPLKRFTRVLMQQGRVQLDSDWNEQTALTLEYVRRLARDLLGRGAGPEENCGFRIATRRDLAVPRSGDPFSREQRAALDLNADALNKGDLLILSGRYYVGGLPLELGESILYSEQAGYPFDAGLQVDEFTANGTSWLAYLDVWEEFVSAEDDESLRDPALGGADTCGRARIRWQVRLLAAPGGTDDFLALSERPRGRLSARTRPDGTGDRPGGYHGLENRLYRVEIHHGSETGGRLPTFKWSRDNGSRSCAIETIEGDRIRLRSDAFDRLGIASGTWVELSSDRWIGRDPQGALMQVADVKRDERYVLVDWAGPSPLPTAPGEPDAPRLKLTRWDHVGQQEHRGAFPIEEGVEIELEDGIFVRFEPGGPYRPGDYWLIPARTATRDILWREAADRGPALEEPHGPVHHYAPLAIFARGKLKDLRSKFGPISR